MKKGIFKDVIFNDEDEDERKRRSATELKDLTVDRVDGVDRPATGRNFLLFKSEDGPRPYADDDEMTDSERRARGVAALGGRKFKVSYADTLFGDATRHAVREFPLESQPTRGPRMADSGEDTLGRPYADGEFIEQYASMGGLSAIPNAGAGDTWEGDTRDLENAPQRFSPGAAGYVGGEDRGVRPVDPNLGKGGCYSLREIGQLEDVVTRVGEFIVLSPRDPGIAPAAQFIKPEPATVAKSGRTRGVFKSAVFGAHGDQADSFLS